MSVNVPPMSTPTRNRVMPSASPASASDHTPSLRDFRMLLYGFLRIVLGPARTYSSMHVLD